MAHRPSPKMAHRPSPKMAHTPPSDGTHPPSLIWQVDLQPDEIIVEVTVPHCAPLEFVLPFKQARPCDPRVTPI
eukprot:1917575-Prymnesium_polylepis.1